MIARHFKITHQHPRVPLTPTCLLSKGYGVLPPLAFAAAAAAAAVSSINEA
jgi:hypothetical protein